MIVNSIFCIKDIYLVYVLIMKEKILSLFTNPTLRRKLLMTIALLALYRLLVRIPVPFADVGTILSATGQVGNSALGYFSMLLWGSLENFSIIAVGLAPYINASILMQLLGSLVPKIEELQEQWESGQKIISQYTRWLSVPLAFIQGIGMVFFINQIIPGAVNTGSSMLLLSAFALMVGSVILMWIGELITEYGLTNGTSLLIFASIVSGITSKLGSSVSSSGNPWQFALFVLTIVIVLIILSVLLIKTIKEIPIIYAKQGKVQQTSMLPFPLNPVGMVPIIFAIAFTSFPYLASQLITKVGSDTVWIMQVADWVNANFNIYVQNPSWYVTLFYFLLIVFFTFFYAIIQFNPEKIADNIQKRWWFIPSIRPGIETVNYINKILMHLCLWGGIGLGLLGIYSYVMNYIPFIQNLISSLWSIPVIVTGSGIVIVVGVVQELMNKVQSEMVMSKYDK